MIFSKRLNQLLAEYLFWMRIRIQDTLPGTPRDFAWKVRWRMRHDKNPIFVELADKYKVKDYVQSHGIKTSESYYVTDKPQTIPFDSLPETYFIKANHGSLWNIFCKDGKYYLFGNGESFPNLDDISRPTLTKDECIQECKRWLRSVYSKREWVYGQIPPKIMIEQTLLQKGGGEFKDYKFYVFHGRVQAVWLICSTYRRNREKLYFDREWNVIKLDLHGGEKLPDLIPERPDNYNEMVIIAEKLAEGLDFVRIDLYDTTQGIVFGEMTFYPFAGWPSTPTSDPLFNQWLGDQWKLPIR